jgi:hypothetical protein
MTWTYGGAPGTTTSATRRDAVRLLVGDTDTTDQQVSDEEIAFALSQTSDDIYNGGALICRALAGTYSRLVDTSIESVSSSYSQRAAQYSELAARLVKEGKRFGSVGLGVPVAGGMSISEMESVEDDLDRVPSAFRVDQFSNPPRFDPMLDED